MGTILTWNVTNWITVSLTAIITFGLIGLAQKSVAGKQE